MKPRYTPRRSVLYWNDGNPRFWDARVGKLMDMGRMACKAKMRRWCRRCGIEFSDRRTL